MGCFLLLLRRQGVTCARSFGCALSFAVLFGAGAASADEMKIVPSLSETGVWDSNPLMRRDHVTELYGATTAAKLDVEQLTPTADFVGGASVENNIFDQHEFDSTDFHGKLKLAKRTERLEVALAGAGDYDTTRTSEVSNLGDESATARHLGYNAAPSVRYALSQLSSVSLAGQYLKSSYDEDSHTDYHTLSLTPEYERYFTERYAGLLSLNARRYETDEGVDRRVDSVGPAVGIVAKLSEQWTGDARIGQEASREERAGTVVQDWSWSSVYSANFAFKGEQDQLRLSSTRAQQSYSNGTDTLLTTFDFDGTRKINELFSVNVGLTYQFSDDEQSDSNRLDVLCSGKAGVTYHITEALGLTSSYRYKHETYTQADGAARQNIVRLGLTYRPQFEAFW